MWKLRFTELKGLPTASEGHNQSSNSGSSLCHGILPPPLTGAQEEMGMSNAMDSSGRKENRWKSLSAMDSSDCWQMSQSGNTREPGWPWTWALGWLKCFSVTCGRHHCPMFNVTYVSGQGSNWYRININVSSGPQFWNTAWSDHNQ